MKTMLMLLTLHGWIDAYYASNPAHPRPRLNFFSGIGTTAHHANQPALNVAAFEIAHDPKPVGFHLILIGGDSADVVHSGEQHRDRHTIRNLFQATVSYNAPVGRGLALEAGVYPSHIGYEGFFTKDNWNYTRSTLGELAPYARYALNDRHPFALRAERFRDPHAGISGFEQTLTEGTFTYEHRPSAHFILKFEGRRDHSSAAVFNGSRNQRLAVASVVATY